MVGFFLEGETSFDGLEGARGGVLERTTGGALHGDRCFLGVGELQSVLAGWSCNGKSRVAYLLCEDSQCAT